MNTHPGEEESRETQIIQKVMSELVNFLSLSNPLELLSDHFLCQITLLGGIYKDFSIWLDGARPPPELRFQK
jgi:hypothetical protein